MQTTRRLPAFSSIMKILVFGSIIVAITSCSSKSSPEIKTVRFQPDGAGFIQFSTNESKNVNSTFSVTYSSTDITPSIITAVVKKTSGAANVGFGVVFGYHNAINIYYRVMITISGGVAVYKRNTTEGSTPIQDWSTSAGIVNTGYGATNTITVTYAASQYTVAVNGTSVSIFSPDGEIGTSGSSGFYASVGSAENFPDVPVDVRFKMLAPVLKP